MCSRRLLSSIVLAVALVGCKPPPGPDDVYRAFAAAARAGDSGQVYGLLSERSRAAYDAEAKALAAREPGVSSNGRDLVLGDLSAGAPRITKLVMLRESPLSAVLEITVEGSDRMGEVEMVHEQGSWRVVLPNSKAARSP